MAALSAYMSEAASRALPAEVIEKSKHHILDTLAAMVSGSELPPGQFAIRYARARPGDTVLLLGKGHEGSIIGPSGPMDWDEKREAEEALRSLGLGG